MASAGVELKVVKGSSTEEALRNRMCVAPDALPENVKHVSVKPRDANRRFAFTIERSSRVVSRWDDDKGGLRFFFSITM